MLRYKKKRVKIANQPEWITEEILQKRTEHDHCKDIGNEDNYRQTRNRVTNMMELSKTEYYTTLVETTQGNSKKLWSYLKELVPKCVNMFYPVLLMVKKTNRPTRNSITRTNEWVTSIVLKYIEDHQNKQISNNDYLLLSNFIQSKIVPSTKFSTPPPIEEEIVHELLAYLDEHKTISLDGVSAKLLWL